MRRVLLLILAITAFPYWQAAIIRFWRKITSPFRSAAAKLRRNRKQD